MLIIRMFTIPYTVGPRYNTVVGLRNMSTELYVDNEVRQNTVSGQ